jgi:hypothetical protein
VETAHEHRNKGTGWETGRTRRSGLGKKCRGLLSAAARGQWERGVAEPQLIGPTLIPVRWPVSNVPASD